MNVVYLQCDIRYNKWLLEKIEGKYVIQHTIAKCMEICKKCECYIVAGIYDCAENSQLIDVLNEFNVKTLITNEINVNRRFLDSVIKEEVDYVIRVGGDQCLIDSDKIVNILELMKKSGMEWFYDEHASCILPDIINAVCLKKWEEELRKGDRYFNILDKVDDIKRYRLPYPMLVLFNFRANSNEGFRICNIVITEELDIYELSQRLQSYLTKSEYLVKTGLWGSWLIPPEIGEFYYDEKQGVNPWWGRSIVDLVKRHLNRSLYVFEWGTGNSTLFWSQYVKQVVSVEHDKEWYEKMKNVVSSNVVLKYHELEYGGEYCRSILDENKEFDIILIDGRDRVGCALNAVMRLKEDGVIIWDNSDRERYESGYEFLKEQGFKQIEISGIVYGLPGKEEFTSIFYRENNFFGL